MITVPQVILRCSDFNLCFTSVALFLASANPTIEFTTGKRSSVFLKKNSVLRMGFYEVSVLSLCQSMLVYIVISST